MNNIHKLYELIFGEMPLRNYRDYDQYWKLRNYSASAALRRAEIISKFIKPEKRILDIGCGDGTIIKFISDHNNPRSIVGVDVSKSIVDCVKRLGFEAFNIDILSDEFEYFLKNNTFDYIITTEVLEHIQDPEHVIQTINKYQNASLFISIPNAGFFPHRLRLLLGRFPLVVIQTHVKEHIRFWTLKDFMYWINFFGFKVNKIIPCAGVGVRNTLGLGNLCPSVFANQIIYYISK